MSQSETNLDARNSRGFFFHTDPINGSSERRQLFGFHHRSSTSKQLPSQPAVVIVYPFGYEYVHSHWLFVKLARDLARRGSEVLRFDFSGCGDSAGDLADARVEDWLVDIATASRQLLRSCSERPLYLVGARLGATLAAQYALRDEAVAGLVLWDPVISGSDYVTELRRFHKIWKLRNFSRESAGQTTECVGFSLSAPLQTDFESLDLLKEPLQGRRRVLLIGNDRVPGCSEFEAELSTRHALQRLRPPESITRIFSEKGKEDLQRFDSVISEIANWVLPEGGGRERSF